MAKRISLPESELDSGVLTGGQTAGNMQEGRLGRFRVCTAGEGDLTSRVNEIQPSAHILRGVYLGPGRCVGVHTSALISLLNVIIACFSITLL